MMYLRTVQQDAIKPLEYSHFYLKKERLQQENEDEDKSHNSAIHDYLLHATFDTALGTIPAQWG
jgi:hypothetical protein